MKRFLLLALVITLFITACGDRSVGNGRVNTVTPVTPAVDPLKSTAPGLSPVVNSPATASVAASSRLNPAHGQPGHRCDLAVGAPLPADNNAAPSVQQVLPSAINTTPAVSTGTGLNPAHGQPGHRCDIAVGAPLTSEKAVPGIQQPVSPAVNATPQPAASTAGLNPAHGQPGHRCDIAVGAPLDSKPSK
jgi:hypothetical protein